MTYQFTAHQNIYYQYMLTSLTLSVKQIFVLQIDHTVEKKMLPLYWQLGQTLQCLEGVGDIEKYIFVMWKQ